ncbi:MAG: ATP-dependent protease ATPase subunit HslU [Alphaproteobacteria bacterium]
MKNINFTPRETVSELDRFIIGQKDAKKAVAIALRNRWRRQQLPKELAEEVMPRNILMIGPTGVGKTEIARRLAKLAHAPFVKVEATRFTEVGYVGRDVEQMIRDLVDISIMMTREEKRKMVRAKAEVAAEERIIDAFCGKKSSEETRQKFRTLLRDEQLEDKEVEIQVVDKPKGAPMFEVPGMPGAQMGMMNLGDMLGDAFGGKKTKPRKMKVKDSRELLIAEESDNLLDEEEVIREAIFEAENNGIVFIDEIDKICARSERSSADVNREGVQRDLLPMVEGTTVSTKHGTVKTDHILFIASGAFHLARPSDLLPELQGRLPIRVELRALTQEDFKRILLEPENNLIMQYTEMLKVEGVDVQFTDDAIEAIASASVKVNDEVENIGARRLQTVLEKLTEEISFNAPEKEGEVYVIDAAMVDASVGEIARNRDLTQFIL